MNGMGCAKPVAVSHSRILLSSEPLARILESSDQHIVLTPARWPSSVCSSAPVLASQILMVQSADAEASQRPSGENLTQVMPFLWPRRIRVGE